MANNYILVDIDKSVFVKSTAEKLKLSALRNSHRRALRKLGLNPKKTFNDNRIPL